MSQPAIDPDELSRPHPEDPVGENPVPQGHPAHKVWEEATAAALEEVYRLNAEMLAEQPKPDDLQDWRQKLVFLKYQIWAQRNLTIVRNEKDARSYEQWLDNYLQSWIVTLTAKFGLPTPIFKAQLVGACNYWKGNAWAQVRAFGLRLEPNISPDVIEKDSRIEKSVGPDKPAERRGRRPNRKRREAIRSAMSKHSDQWRDHLSDIFGELDGSDVPLGDFEGREIDLGDGESTKVWKWDDLNLAQGEQLKQIIDALRKYADSWQAQKRFRP